MSRAARPARDPGSAGGAAQRSATAGAMRRLRSAVLRPLSPNSIPLVAGGLAGLGFALVGAVLTAAWTPAPVAVAAPRMQPRPEPPPGPRGFCLRLDGRSALRIPIRLDAAPLTIECWVRAATVSGVRNVFGNTENGGVELIWSSDTHPLPVGWIRTARAAGSRGAGWTTLAASDMRSPGTWAHVALVVEESRARIFLDGGIVAECGLAGAPVASEAAFVIGADADGELGIADRFEGWIDSFRVSRTVRYRESFRPDAAPACDAHTLLALDFDDPVDPWRDSGSFRCAVKAIGSPELDAVR